MLYLIARGNVFGILMSLFQLFGNLFLQFRRVKSQSNNAILKSIYNHAIIFISTINLIREHGSTIILKVRG